MSIKDLDSYELVKEEKLSGIHSEGFLLRHKKSGARVLLVENEDENLEGRAAINFHSVLPVT